MFCDVVPLLGHGTCIRDVTSLPCLRQRRTSVLCLPPGADVLFSILNVFLSFAFAGGSGCAVVALLGDKACIQALGTAVFPTVREGTMSLCHFHWACGPGCGGLTVTAGVSEAFRRLGRWTELSTRKSRPHAEAGLRAKNSGCPLAHTTFLVLARQGVHCPRSHS